MKWKEELDTFMWDDEPSGGDGETAEEITQDSEPIDDADEADEPEPPAAEQEEDFAPPARVIDALWGKPSEPQPGVPQAHQQPAPIPPQQQAVPQHQYQAVPPQQQAPPPPPDPALLDTNPEKYHQQSMAYMNAAIQAGISQYAQRFDQRLYQYDERTQREHINRVARAVQDADSAVNEAGYGKNGVFTKSALYRGNESVRKIADDLMVRHMQRALDAALTKADESLLLKCGEPGYLRSVLAIAVAQAGLDFESPKPAKVKGAAVADATGPGQQTRLSKADQRALKEAEEVYGIRITEKDLLEANRKLNQKFD